MKKLILGAAMMLGFISVTTAQKMGTQAPAIQKPAVKKAMPEKPAVAPTATQKPAVKKESPAKPAVAVPAVKPEVKAPAKTTDATGVVLKKDGTPDKLFKKTDNKEKAPLKKDGTPDKRFKENKTN